MENLKFTKGEWVYYGTGHEVILSSTIEIGSTESSAWICKVQNNGVIGKKEGEANAKLIAASPILLEALMMSQRLLLSIEGESFKEWPEYHFIQSIINKATK